MHRTSVNATGGFLLRSLTEIASGAYCIARSLAWTYQRGRTIVPGDRMDIAN